MTALLVALGLMVSPSFAQDPAPQPTDPVEQPVPRPEPAPAPAPQKPAAPIITALVGATIIPGDASPAIEDGVLLVQERRILAVGTRAEVGVPEGATIIDRTGRFIMPGLIDAHVHFSQSGSLYTRPDAFDLRDVVPYEEDAADLREGLNATFQRFLAAGVTSVFDVGGPNWVFSVRDAANGSRAPRVAVTGPLIATEPTPRQERLIFEGDAPIISAGSPEEAANLARSLVPSKPEAFKIWGIGSGPDGASKIEAITRAVAEVGDENGIRVAVHATTLQTAKAAVRGGADILVHSIEDRAVDAEFISLLKANDVTLITSMVVYEGYRDAVLGKPDLSVEERRLADPQVLASLYGMPVAMQQDYVASFAPRREVVLANAKTLYEAGVRLAMGTDAGNVGTLHGGSVHRELELLAEAGIPNEDIIRIATKNGAEAIRPNPSFGTLEPGFSADFLVLRADPRADIANAANIETVWLRGYATARRDLIPRTPEAVVQEQLDAYNAHNLDSFSRNFSRNVEIFFLPNTVEPRISGMENLRSVYGQLFELPDDEKIRCDVVERIVEGAYVFDQERCRGLDGRTVRARATAIYQIEGERIRRVWFAR